MGRGHVMHAGQGADSCLRVGCRKAFRNILIVYASVCSLWIPLNFWVMPWHALHIGQVQPRACCADSELCLIVSCSCLLQLQAPPAAVSIQNPGSIRR